MEGQADATIDVESLHPSFLTHVFGRGCLGKFFLLSELVSGLVSFAWKKTRILLHLRGG